VNSYNVWNYDEGHDSYYASMLVDLTLPPDEVSHVLSRQIHVHFVSKRWARLAEIRGPLLNKKAMLSQAKPRDAAINLISS